MSREVWKEEEERGVEGGGRGVAGVERCGRRRRRREVLKGEEEEWKGEDEDK